MVCRVSKFTRSSFLINRGGFHVLEEHFKVYLSSLLLILSSRALTRSRRKQTQTSSFSEMADPGLWKLCSRSSIARPISQSSILSARFMSTWLHSTSASIFISSPTDTVCRRSCIRWIPVLREGNTYWPRRELYLLHSEAGLHLSEKFFQK